MPYLNRVTALLASVLCMTSATAADDPYAEPVNPGLPPSSMELEPSRVALVVTDPQIDFLSEKGVTWGWLEKASPKTKQYPISSGCSERPGKPAYRS